jgi:hypothetical protein
MSQMYLRVYATCMTALDVSLWCSNALCYIDSDMSCLFIYLFIYDSFDDTVKRSSAMSLNYDTD